MKNIFFIFTGIVLFAGVVLWKITLEETLAPTRKRYIPGKTKPTDLLLPLSFPPTSLMISVILAVSSAVMIIVHTCTSTNSTGSDIPTDYKKTLQGT